MQWATETISVFACCIGMSYSTRSWKKQGTEITLYCNVDAQFEGWPSRKCCQERRDQLEERHEFLQGSEVHRRDITMCVRLVGRNSLTRELTACSITRIYEPIYHCLTYVQLHSKRPNVPVVAQRSIKLHLITARPTPISHSSGVSTSIVRILDLRWILRILRYILVMTGYGCTRRPSILLQPSLPGFYPWVDRNPSWAIQRNTSTQPTYESSHCRGTL